MCAAHSYVLDLLGDERRGEYGKYRLWLAVSWGVGNALMGWVADHCGFDYNFVISGCLNSLAIGHPPLAPPPPAGYPAAFLRPARTTHRTTHQLRHATHRTPLQASWRPPCRRGRRANARSWRSAVLPSRGHLLRARLTRRRALSSTRRRARRREMMRRRWRRARLRRLACAPPSAGRGCSSSSARWPHSASPSRCALACAPVQASLGGTQVMQKFI